MTIASTAWRKTPSPPNLSRNGDSSPTTPRLPWNGSLQEHQLQEKDPLPNHRQRIQHTHNQGKYHIPSQRWRVDGSDKTSNMVLEFLGCFWHGCHRCFRNHQELYRSHDSSRRLLWRTHECLLTFNTRFKWVRKSGMWTTLPSTRKSIRTECIPSAILSSSMNPAPLFSPSTLVWLCVPSSCRRICFTLSGLTGVEESSPSHYVAPVWRKTLTNLCTKIPFRAITPRMNGC